MQRALLAIVRATDELESGGGSGNGRLVLDEPTPFLPRRDVDQLFDVVRSVVKTGASVIFVSHDVDEVLEITDRATVLRDGRVVARLVTARSSKNQFIEAIVGRRLSMTERMAAPAASGATQVEVTGLSGGSIVSLGFSAGEGEIVGLTGLIGSGYDEIPYLLYGAKPATGDLRLAGKVISLAELTPRAAIDSGIVLIPADRPGAGAIGALSVADNVTIPVIGIGLRRWLLNCGELFRTAAALGEQFDVRPPDPRLAMSNLSGGNQDAEASKDTVRIYPCRSVLFVVPSSLPHHLPSRSVIRFRGLDRIQKSSSIGSTPWSTRRRGRLWGPGSSVAGSMPMAWYTVAAISAVVTGRSLGA